MSIEWTVLSTTGRDLSNIPSPILWHLHHNSCNMYELLKMQLLITATTIISLVRSSVFRLHYCFSYSFINKLVGRTLSTDLLGAQTTGRCAGATTGVATDLAHGASGAATLLTHIIDTGELDTGTIGWSANPAARIATDHPGRTFRFAALLERRWRNRFTGHKDGTAGTLFAALCGKERRFRLAFFSGLAQTTRQLTGW
jgi:hypothetical protein